MSELFHLGDDSFSPIIEVQKQEQRVEVTFVFPGEPWHRISLTKEAAMRLAAVFQRIADE